MADITSRYQGNVSDEGKMNWRGDQTTLVPGSQSILESSTVKLADLGSRKVVGDRVFRYAKAGDTIGAGFTVESGWETLTGLVAIGSTSNAPAGSKTFSVTAATAIVTDTYSGGYLICEAGATDSNLGMVYGIKGNSTGPAAGTCLLSLYEPLKYVQKDTSTWSIFQNPYINVHSAYTTAACLGIAPIAVTTGDYFWLQTWGPAAVRGTAAIGDGLISSVSGKCTVVVASDPQMGIAVEALSAAANFGMVFLTVLP